MRRLYKLPLRFRSLFRRSRADQELSDEVRFHLEKLIEEKVAKGMAPEEARYAALRELGSVEQIKEECRDTRRVNYLEHFLRDVQFGFRMLAKNPGFTGVAVFTLAIGIALNTAVFTAFNATALRRIQATEPARIVAVYRSTLQDRIGRAFNYPDYQYYRERNKVFDGLFAASEAEVSLSDEANTGQEARPAGGITSVLGFRFFRHMAGTAELGRAAMVTENYFPTLGINPVMGRSFGADEPYPVAMLSYNFWVRRFKSDPGLLGKTLKLNGRPFTVIGITPKDFIGTYQNAPSVWLPLSAYPLIERGRDPLHNSNDECCTIFGRLKRGVSRQQAQAEMTVLADQLRRTYSSGSKNSRPISISIAPASPFGFRASPEIITMLASLMSAVGLVLLIACANVAGLQLARSSARAKEIGVRLALGASRGRLVQQLLTEASILAVLAGGAGLLGSWFVERFLVTSVAAALPPEWGFLAIDVNPDLYVFGYTLAVSLVTGILFGLTPALQASKPSLISVLKDEGVSFAGKLSGLRLRHFFIAAQVAICLVLLIAAGLLARGSARAVKLDPGFETRRVLGLDIEVPPGAAFDTAKSGAIVHQLLQRFEAVPGVKEVARGRVPLGGGVRTASVSLEAGLKPSSTPPPELYYSYVTPNYFETLAIPIVRGRTFMDAEARARTPVTVISEAAAKRFWPGQDAIGRRIILDATGKYHTSDEPFPTGQAFRVVGVSKDIRSGWLNEIDPAHFFLPLAPTQYYETMMIRAENDPNSLNTALSKEVSTADPSLIVYAETLDGLITMNPGFVLSRVGAVFSSIIGLLGLLLASVGIYGMVSYAVLQRTHEVGIRMALGGRRSDILKLMLRQSARPVAVGMLVGLVLSAAISRLLSSLLFGVSSLDPVSFLGVSLVLTSVALVACYVPARRATEVDPLVALRYE